jgi:acyl carrier protein
MSEQRPPSLDDVEVCLAELIHEIGQIPRERIVAGATVDEALRMESVALIELQVALEERYQIEVDPIRIVELNEFSAIANYVFGAILSVSSIA